MDFGFGFGTWIPDLDLGMDLGLTIACKNRPFDYLSIVIKNVKPKSRSEIRNLKSFQRKVNGAGADTIILQAKID